MTDIVDSGNDAADLFLKAAMTAPRNLHLPAADGKCHNCEASVPPGVRWCDLDCQRDWEKHERAVRMRARDDE